VSIVRRASAAPPDRGAYTAAERKLIAKLRTPRAVQRHLNEMAYNNEPGKPTLKSFREVVRQKNVHCLEAAIFAAAVLEHHGYPPLLLSFESIDKLDHVLFIFRERGTAGGRSIDRCAHSRRVTWRPSSTTRARSPATRRTT